MAPGCGCQIEVGTDPNAKMAESIEQTIRRRRRDAKAWLRSTGGLLRSAVSTALNFSVAFEHRAMICLYLKRLKNCEAAKELKYAVKIVKRASKKLFPKNQDLLFFEFVFCHAAYFQAIDELYITPLVAKFFERNEKKKKDSYYYEGFFDGIVLNCLSGNISPEAVSFDREKAKSATSALSVDSFQCYLSLISAFEERDSMQITETIKKCERLYQRRSRDEYFVKGGQLDGGLDPDTIVDFRLGAICRMMEYRCKVVLDYDSVHLWH